MASADLRDELTCSICLKIYRHPVTMPCGLGLSPVQSRQKLTAQNRSRSYMCPKCQLRLPKRPTPMGNENLSSLVEGSQHAYPEKAEVKVNCTYCIQSQVPAAKTCLLCEASLCEDHLRVHSKSEEHILVNPTMSMGNRKCSVHRKILEYYCCEDVTCICLSCSLAGEHRGHQVEPLNEASNKKKETLRNILQKLTSQREEAEKRVQSLEELRRQVQGKTAGVTERVIALIRDIREQLEALEKRVLSEISRQEEQVSLRVSDLIQQVEMKKEELSRNIGDIEELCDMTDPITFLQEEESDSYVYYEPEEGDNEEIETDCDILEHLEVGIVSLSQHSGLADIVTTLKRQLNVLDEKLMDTYKASGSASDVRNNSDTLLYVNLALGLLFDVETASNNVSISTDFKTATWSETNQNRLETPKRFQYHHALSSRIFSSGRHSWELEVSESGDWRLGMAYLSTERRGKLSGIGNNKQSWCLERLDRKYSVRYDNKVTSLSGIPRSQRIKIELDYEAGCLSFYELYHLTRHLHTFYAAFTEPLHLGCRVFMNTWVKIIS